MPEYNIAGVQVNFPFEPYEVQRAYMEKLIKCLQNGTNGILESPTGTGKTLSLLCASLAWLLAQKTELQAHIERSRAQANAQAGSTFGKVSDSSRKWGISKIIYASRTHSQLSQAMQELKRSAYASMRAIVLGSRDQMCIHPEVSKEPGNAAKTQMCQLRVKTNTCSFHSRVESRKDDPQLRGPTILDIEDLVKVGQKLKLCPYYASKELNGDADITFMPYNYLLDPKARKANKIELSNAIIILDEAHNIEKICEESASVQIRSSEIATAIDDVTQIMKSFNSTDGQDLGDEPKDFTIDDLALLKEMLLDFEKAVDDIVLKNLTNQGETFPASYMFEILEKANFNLNTAAAAVHLLDKLLQFMAVQNQNSPFRKGASFMKISDLLLVVYFNKEELAAKIHRSFKMHVQIEEVKKSNNFGGSASKDSWLTKSTTSTSKSPKIINFWCFNPGFGMEQLLGHNARSVILTSGTLAPLKPLIAELGIPIAEMLENPHIVDSSQVYVRIIGCGPDGEPLVSNYANRDNPKYISSLGQTILNVSRIVPDGLLVFFPSYPLLNQCVNTWQASGHWSEISKRKPIFVEPRHKDDFINTMEEFYRSVREEKGACFMAVCRGKVSEGLDFADRNGRAVIITGLPFPPMMDPKVVLKKRYLDENRTKENELLSGQDWYGLDATRAVNQAIGRVIRHRHDYGAILLCDSRFQHPSQVKQLSKWVRNYMGDSPKSTPFGSIVRELHAFFKQANTTIPPPKERTVNSLVQESWQNAAGSQEHPSSSGSEKAPSSSACVQKAIEVEKTNSIEFWTAADYKAAAGSSSTKAPKSIDFMSRLNTNVSSIDFNNAAKNESNHLVKIHKRERSSPTTGSANTSNDNNSAEAAKKRRYKLVQNNATTLQDSSVSPSISAIRSFSYVKQPQMLSDSRVEPVAPEDRIEFLRVLKSILSPENFSAFSEALKSYKRENTFEELIKLLIEILGKAQHQYMLLGMRRFFRNEHKALFDQRIAHIM